MYDCIIIGAGMAGLYAGYKMCNKNILVLEKNSYIGGRAGSFNFHSKEVLIGAGIGRYDKDILLKELLTDFNIPINTFPIKVSYAFDHIDVNNIYKFLKSKYNGEKCTFKEYALKHLDSYLYYDFIKSVGFTDYENEDVYETLYYYGMEDNLGGWTAFSVSWKELINKMVNKISDKRIKCTTEVKRISSLQNAICVITDTQKYLCKKLIIATEINGINKLLPQLNDLYSNIKPNTFMRIYAHFTGNSKKQMNILIKNTTVIDSYLYKIIPIDKEKGIYMIGYSDNRPADELYKKVSEKNGKEWLEVVLTEALQLETRIKINDMIYFYWKTGTHYFAPLEDEMIGEKDITREDYINIIQNPITNIYVCGEAVSRDHGWVEGSLNSTKNILDKMI